MKQFGKNKDFVLIFYRSFWIDPKNGGSMRLWTEKQNGRHPPPTVLPWFGTLWLFPISKNEIKAERMPVGTIEAIQAKSQRVLDTDRKGLPGTIPKMEETVGYLCWVTIVYFPLLGTWMSTISVNLIGTTLFIVLSVQTSYTSCSLALTKCLFLFSVLVMGTAAMT